MNKGARYTVKTRYGIFSLDEGSYRDYLAGKLWINWPPEKKASQQPPHDSLPPDVSREATALRDRAAKAGVLDTLQDFAVFPDTPYKERMRDLSIYELSLSVRSSNGLMRAGIQTYSLLNQRMKADGGLSTIRNLGIKSVKEIRETFIVDCYTRLLPYEKAEFWQEVLDANVSG